MYKVIDGKRYNTETAERIAIYSEGGGPRDFRHWSEELYRKRNGEFFLFGEGGPMSKYNTYDGNNQWSGGTRIVPITYEQAQKWAEEYLSGEEYDEIFGEIDEDNERQTVTFSLPSSVCEKLLREAAKAGLSKSELVSNLIMGIDNK